MTIYVDPLFMAVSSNVQAKRHGNQWCHLISDTSIEELHEFALSIGLKRQYFQKCSVPHYDLTPNKRSLAVQKGAIEGDHALLSPIRQRWMKQWHGGKPSWDQTNDNHE